MTTILERERYSGLPPEQRREIAAAERVAHDAALAIFEYLQVYLPPELKGRAMDVAAVGLISAACRLIAERRQAEAGPALVEAIRAILPQEYAHWARVAEGADVHH